MKNKEAAEVAASLPKPKQGFYNKCWGSGENQAPTFS
jgi:hypothetical protein